MGYRVINPEEDAMTAQEMYPTATAAELAIAEVAAQEMARLNAAGKMWSNKYLAAKSRFNRALGL